MWQCVPDVVLFVLRGLGHVGSFRLAAEGERRACAGAALPCHSSLRQAPRPLLGPILAHNVRLRCCTVVPIYFSSLTLTFVVTALARSTCLLLRWPAASKPETRL